MNTNIETKEQVTAITILDTRTKKKDNTHSVKLRITYKRKQKYYSIKYECKNLSLTKEDYEKVILLRPRGKYKTYKQYLQIYENKVIEVISKMDYFDFKLFEDVFFNKSSAVNDVFSYYNLYIYQLNSLNKFSTKDTYAASMNSIKQFSDTKILDFRQVTPTFLNLYEKHMLDNSKSTTTISIYLRCLRKIFNDYIEDNKLAIKYYPFGVKKYQIPNAKNFKRALSKHEIKKIFDYKPETGTTEHFARDIFIFSYLANGLNIVDILNLKYKDIQNNRIFITRQKTKNSRKSSPQIIEIIINEKLQEIIKLWGKEKNTGDGYIFPHFEGIKDEVKRLREKQQTTKTVNKYLKRIGEKLELNLKLTTQVARHSFATILMRSGAPQKLIGDSMGHSSVKTTENYLGSFGDDMKQEYFNKLTDF